MSEKHENTYKHLNYFEHLLISASTITSCVLISAFASLVCVPIGISSFAVGIKRFAITSGIKKYKSIIKKKKKMSDKIVLLGRDKLNAIEVLIAKALIDSYITHDELLVNNVLTEYSDVEEEIKNIETSVELAIEVSLI